MCQKMRKEHRLGSKHVAQKTAAEKRAVTIKAINLETAAKDVGVAAESQVTENKLR